ncbi:unnamed protein product [Prorocentrum cordatum]|uniref:Uncharacterized protein n=1 Tax=Prorocentrum cordatum TaxID=2364126 RepID=A0ABN9X4I2_9DINO|nr:unnamed protein product [Polarella glacialis]
MFRFKFRAELSETSLGHAKLSELLQDARVSDLCTVKLQKHGYAVFPAAKAQAARASAISLADSLTPPAAAAVAEAPPRRARPAPLSLDAQDSQGCARGDEITEIGNLHVSVVQVAPAAGGADAGILFPPTPEAATPCWAPRAAYAGQAAPTGPLPTLLGRPAAQPGGGGAKDADSAAKAGAAIIADCIKAAQHSQPPLEEERNIWTMQLVTPSTLGHLRGSLEQNTFIHVPEPLPTPEAAAPQRRLSRALSAEL